MYHFNEETLVQSIYAARTIYAGEEITVTCMSPFIPPFFLLLSSIPPSKN
jgi:hypothetical protein